MNSLLNGLKNETNYKLTENGAVARTTTNSPLLDMFAMGGAMRSRDDEDIILMFKKAYEENPAYALKCLFYFRDIRGGGQGERRFFRICYNWLAENHPEAAKRNMEFIPEFGRWDDLYCLENTSLEHDMFGMIHAQLLEDLISDTPSLCAKWLPSCNTSSHETCRLGAKTAKAFGLSHAHYRKILSHLREKINVLERLMSANKWDKIDFSAIPSRAGLLYRNAFATRSETKDRYAAFASDKNTKVNAGALYPYEIVEKAINTSSVEREMINKYWENLPNWLKDANFNALCVCDTSGSMHGTPINVAISLALYCAERAGGPFANHYISFSSRPQLIECEGFDFVDKVGRIYSTNLCENTNLEAVFDLLLDTAIKNHVSQSELPENIIIVSDMEIDQARGVGAKWNPFTLKIEYSTNAPMEMLMESIRKKWAENGYVMPKLIYWNVDARHNTILDSGPDVSYVSGFSPSIFKQIITGKTGEELMFETLNSERYSMIY